MININRLNIEKKVFNDALDAYVPKTAYISLNSSLKDIRTSIKDIRKQLPAENTRVKEGQILLNKGSFEACVHASIPGIITGYKDISMPNGKKSTAAVIKLDGEFSYLGRKLIKNKWENFTELEIISMLAEKGVYNSFYNKQSLASEIKECNEKQIERRVFAVRLFDSDPSCSTDSFLVSYKPAEVFEGIAILAKSLKADKVYLLHDESYNPDEKEAGKVFENLEYKFIQFSTKKYPFINKVRITDNLRKHKEFTQPLLFTDVKTAYSVFESVAFSKPVLETYVQVSGNAVTKPSMLKVRLGTPIMELIEQCCGLKSQPYKVIINGLIKGISISDLNTPVTSEVKSITLLSRFAVSDQKQIHCIRCGNCHRACPAGLQPDKIFSAFFFHTEIPEAVKKSISKCTICGTCNMSCPSRLPLSQTMSLIKGEKINER